MERKCEREEEEEVEEGEGEEEEERHPPFICMMEGLRSEPSRRQRHHISSIDLGGTMLVRG